MAHGAGLAPVSLRTSSFLAPGPLDAVPAVSGDFLLGMWAGSIVAWLLASLLLVVLRKRAR